MTDREASKPKSQHIRSKLDLIEATRGIAAALVVLYHVARHLDKAEISDFWIKIFQFGHSGVDLFFVISGFIIFHVHQKDIGKRNALPGYAIRRITRIYPIYWLALGATIALSILGANPPPNLNSVLASVLLFPSDQEPLLGVAWTLQFEIFFYLLFAALIFNKRIGLIIVSAWMLLIIIQSVTKLSIPAIPKFIFSLYNIQFIFGILTSIAVNHYIKTPKVNLIALGCSIFGIAAALENFGLVNGYSDSMRLIYGGAASLLIAGCASRKHAKTKIPNWLKHLGSASYSIYLFQFIFIGITWKMLSFLELNQPIFSTPIFIALSFAGILGGVFISRTIEYPTMKVIRSYLSANQPDKTEESQDSINKPIKH